MSAWGQREASTAFGVGIGAATLISGALISGARAAAEAGTERAREAYAQRTIESWAAENARLRARAERAEKLAATLAKEVSALEDELAEAEEELEALGGR